MKKGLVWLVPTLVLLGGCRRPTHEPMQPVDSGTTATSEAGMPLADPGTTTTSEAGTPFLVRMRRWGGIPGSLSHTLEVYPDGAARLTGHDSAWCGRAQKTRRDPRDPTVDTHGTIEPEVFAELRALVVDPEITQYAGAHGPARAPGYDGVAVEVTLPPGSPLLVDGVHDVHGKMRRLLDLERELAQRLGAAAACR